MIRSLRFFTSKFLCGSFTDILNVWCVGRLQRKQDFSFEPLEAAAKSFSRVDHGLHGLKLD